MSALFQSPALPNVRAGIERVVLLAVLIVALGIPTGYYVVQFWALDHYLKHVADSSADAVSMLVAGNPELWEYLGSRYHDPMTKATSPGDRIEQRLVDREGVLVFRVGTAPRGAPHAVSVPVSDGIEEVGRLTAVGDLSPILRRTMLLAGLSSAIGLFLFLLLHTMPLRFLGNALDELGNSREALRRLFQGFPDAVFLVDPGTGRIEDFNATAISLTERRPAELKGASFSALFSPGSREQAGSPAIAGATQKQGEIHDLGVLFLVGKNGACRMVATRSIVLGLLAGRRQMVVIARDVTEREETLAALQESEGRYRGFVESFPGIAFRETMDFVPVFFHGAVETITGYREGEFVDGKPRWIDIVHEEDRPVIHAATESLRGTPGFATEREYRIIRRDGRVKVVRENIHNVADAGGGVRWVEGVIFDVTERWEAQEGLRLSEERFRKIGMSAQDAIIVADAAGRVTFWNETAERMFRIERAAIEGKSLETVIAAQRQGDDLMQSLRDYHERETERSALIEVFPMAGLRGGEERFPLEVTLAGIQGRGGWDTVIVARDVSTRRAEERDLRESEERFRRVFELSEDAILLFDRTTGRVLDANPRAVELLNRSRETLVADGVCDALDASDVERLWSAMNGEEADEGFHLTEPIAVPTARGETTVSVSGRLIQLRGAQVIYCLFRDISETVRLHENWKSGMERLIQAEKMTFLGTMVSAFAHDMNNPNQLVALNLPLVRDAWYDALRALEARGIANGDLFLAELPYARARQVVDQALRDMEAGSQRIADIIRNLLSFAREDREGRSERLDMNETVELALSMIRHRIRKATERFSFVGSQSLPSVMGNRTQLERVVINLVLNALEALPARRRGVFVETFCDRDRRQVGFRVRDEGVGMSGEERKKVGTPFFTTKKHSGGVGLGLAISDIIVRDHDGTLEIASEEGTGTTITVLLPGSPENAGECGT